MHARRRPASLATCLLLLLAGACASPGATTPSPTAALAPTPTPLPTTDGGVVASERLGWSMEIPAGWRYRPATEDWPQEHAFPQPGAAYTDNFEHEDGFPVIDVSTRLRSAGQSVDDFYAAFDAGTGTLGCTVESEQGITVDQNPARLQRQLCAAGLETVWEVIAFDGDRIYAIYWLSLTEDSEGDEARFREALETFRFAPPATY